MLIHNVQHWKTRTPHLKNCYAKLNPDIIIINSHGLKYEETLRIRGYNIIKINTTEEINDRSAICIKTNMHYKTYDDFITDVIAIEIETQTGPIIIGTTYLPPRRPYLPFPDIHQLLSNNIPT